MESRIAQDPKNEPVDFAHSPYSGLRRLRIHAGGALLLVAALWLLPTVGLQATVCAPPAEPAVAPPIPTVTPLRGYRYEFRSPLRLALDAAGSLYVADPARGEVLVRAPDGRVIERRHGLGKPAALAIDAAGRIFVGDLTDGAISLYASDWQPLLRFAVGEITQIADLAVDDTRSRLYVSDSEAHRVRVYSTAGAWLFDIGGEGEGDGHFRYPSGLFVDAHNDELLVSDQFGYRVQVFDANGSFKYCIGGSSASPGGFFQRGRLFAAPQGLWADALGRIYVADSFEGKIKVIDRRGRMLGEIGAFGEVQGELRIPSDVAIDDFGRLYVASTNNARIEMFGIDAYSDPESYTPALLQLEPRRLSTQQGGELALSMRVPNVHPRQVALDSLRINDLVPGSVALVDRDRDGEAEIEARVDVLALLRTLPPSGIGSVVVEGATEALRLHARVDVEIIAVDTDRDGIDDDLDLCPATPSMAVVDASGCSVVQYCPCIDFNSHGDYTHCVSQVSRLFVREGLIPGSQRPQLVVEAARSDCGKGKTLRQRGDDKHRDGQGEDHERRNGADDRWRPDDEARAADAQHPAEDDHRHRRSER